MENQNLNGKFRNRKVDYSMIENSVLTAENLSLKAIGLYCKIAYYVSIPNFTLYKSHLMATCIEGERSFNSAWKELKEKGYLVQYKLKDEKNCFYYEYELIPNPEVRFVGAENVALQSEDTQKVGCINNTINNNTINNNNINNNIYSPVSTEQDKVDSEIDNKKAKEEETKEIAAKVIDYLNAKAGTKYKATAKATIKLISARLSEGYTLDDFKTVIDKKCTDWLGGKYETYLRPSTLFCLSHFEEYLNQKEKKNYSKESNRGQGIAFNDIEHRDCWNNPGYIKSLEEQLLKANNKVEKYIAPTQEQKDNAINPGENRSNDDWFANIMNKNQ